MYELKFDREICSSCETVDCLMKCQYINFDLQTAREERDKLNNGEDSFVLHDCVTCYACEEYCQFGNHPFYQIVDLQEEKGVWPTPKPIVHSQMKMYSPKGTFEPQEIHGTAFNMCLFPDFQDSIKGKLFDSTTQMVGRDLFCNLVYLHYAKASVIRERVPQIIKNFASCGVKELVCFHDECYATYKSWAPAYGIEVPFKPVHLFQFLIERLKENQSSIKNLGLKVAYQRPCSTRLVPETEPMLDELFELIGVDRVPRKYDRDTPLCCAAIMRASGREELADEINKKNIDDMLEAGAKVCVFNCQGCYASMGEMVAKAGLRPILVHDLCKLAVGENV